MLQLSPENEREYDSKALFEDFDWNSFWFDEGNKRRERLESKAIIWRGVRYRTLSKYHALSMRMPHGRSVVFFTVIW
jgi:hypothetical protein